MMRPRHAFTMIELLVVIAIIVTLAAVLLPAINLLQTRQKKQATKTLMMQLGQALGQYLQAYERFGDPDEVTPGPQTGTILIQKPWVYLGVRRGAEDLAPWIELKPGQVARVDGSGASLDQGEAILDAWLQPLKFVVWLETKHNRTFVQRIEVSSAMGTTETADDLVLAYALGDAGFAFLNGR